MKISLSNISVVVFVLEKITNESNNCLVRNHALKDYFCSLMILTLSYKILERNSITVQYIRQYNKQLNNQRNQNGKKTFQKGERQMINEFQCTSNNFFILYIVLPNNMLFENIRINKGNLEKYLKMI